MNISDLVAKSLPATIKPIRESISVYCSLLENMKSYLRENSDDLLGVENLCKKTDELIAELKGSVG